jgi:hypothetical protein
MRSYSTLGSANQQQAAQRLLRYPAAISKCSTQSIAYAKCVVANSENNLNKDACLKEFNLFKDCVQNVYFCLFFFF